MAHSIPRPTSASNRSSRPRSRTLRAAVSGLVASAALGSQLALASPLEPPQKLLDRLFDPAAGANVPHATRRPLTEGQPWRPQPRQNAGQPALPSAAGTFRFDIPPGPLANVVKTFEATTGIHVTLVQEGFGSVMSPGVAGVLTPAEALRRLVDGTGLTASLVDRYTATLDVRQSESVTVSAPPLQAASPKYTEPLRDTPQTIVVIPREVLEAQGATSLRDALRNTPGITLTAGEGGTAPGDNLLIRGFSARNDVYVDGARDAGVTSRDTFNTETVEVAKGPSSVTTGRGATGGSVNLVTKRAVQNDFAQIRLTGGSADYARSTMDVNRTLGGSAALRLNAMWQDAGVPRRDEVKQRAWGFAPSLALGLGQPTDVVINYQHLQQNNVPDYGLPGTLPAAAVSEGITVKDLDFSNFYGLTSRDREKLRSDLGTVGITHRFRDAVSLRNLTRYGQNVLDRVVTPPRAATEANSAADPGFDPAEAQIRRTDTKYQFRTDKSLVNQTDLTTTLRTAGLTHELVTGLELSQERQPSYGVTDTFTNGRPPVTDLFAPAPEQPYSPALVRTGASTNGVSNAAGLYAFDTVKAGQRWQGSFGLRWDHVAVDYDNIAADGAQTSFGRTDQALSGRAGVVFRPTPRGSVYAAYSTSFNPSFDGSFGLSLTDAIADLPPERTRNIEAGTKWDVRQGLELAASAFRIEKTNAKTRDLSGATVLAGDQTVNGIEVSLSGRVTDRLSLFSGLSLMKGTVRDSGVADEIGKQLAYVPKASFNLWTTYRVPRARLTLGGGAQFTDGYFFNNTNALTSDNAAAVRDLTRYWLFSAMANVEVNRHLSLQVNGTNLANARYVERGYTGHFLPGPGRAILVGPEFTF